MASLDPGDNHLAPRIELKLGAIARPGLPPSTAHSPLPPQFRDRGNATRQTACWRLFRQALDSMESMEQARPE